MNVYMSVEDFGLRKKEASVPCVANANTGSTACFPSFAFLN